MDFRWMNIMKISGSFSYAENHSWIQFCLVDVPNRPPVDKENSLTYTNFFLPTQLECVYRWLEYFKVLILEYSMIKFVVSTQEVAIFPSENVLTVSIHKDIMSKEAIENKIILNISWGNIPQSY